MLHRRNLLLIVVSLNIICLMSDSVLSQNHSQSINSTEEIVSAGNKSINEGDWAQAESHFREAVRLEPKQTLWRIQLTLALGQQKKWKNAFAEIDKVVKLGALDWLLTINKKLPDGKVAFVNTETFADEEEGILRYVHAVKQNKNVTLVSEKIGEALDDFARQQTLALIFDISKFKDIPLTTGDIPDVTKEFIAYYNQNNPVNR